MKRGLLYNIKELAFRPNQFLREYINVVPRKSLNPISFTIIIITSIVITNGMIENYKAGFVGFEVFEIEEFWDVIIRVILPPYLSIAIIVATLRIDKTSFTLLILESIIASLFFVSQFFLILFVSYLIELILKYLGVDIFNEWFNWILASLTFFVYYYHAFRPKPNLSGTGIGKFLRIISIVISIITAIAFSLFTVIITVESGGVSRPLENMEIRHKFFSYDFFKLQTERLESLSKGGLIKKDSLLVTIRTTSKVLSQHADILKEKILHNTEEKHYYMK
jgi:hypothetical protein